MLIITLVCYTYLWVIVHIPKCTTLDASDIFLTFKSAPNCAEWLQSISDDLIMRWVVSNAIRSVKDRLLQFIQLSVMTPTKFKIVSSMVQIIFDVHCSSYITLTEVLKKYIYFDVPYLDIFSYHVRNMRIIYHCFLLFLYLIMTHHTNSRIGPIVFITYFSNLKYHCGYNETHVIGSITAYVTAYVAKTLLYDISLCLRRIYIIMNTRSFNRFLLTMTYDSATEFLLYTIKQTFFFRLLCYRYFSSAVCKSTFSIVGWENIYQVYIFDSTHRDKFWFVITVSYSNVRHGTLFMFFIQ